LPNTICLKLDCEDEIMLVEILIHLIP
jgi:hypothetical protein